MKYYVNPEKSAAIENWEIPSSPGGMQNQESLLRIWRLDMYGCMDNSYTLTLILHVLQMWSVLTAFFTSSKLMNRTHWILTWQEARPRCPLPSLYFSGRLENQDGRLVFWLADTFLTSTLNQSEFNETWQETRSQWPLAGLFLCPRHKYGRGI